MKNNWVLYVWLMTSIVLGAEFKRLEFSTDFGGGATDSLNLYQGYPDTLSLYRLRRDFISLSNIHLNDSVAGVNRLGAYPEVSIPSPGTVDVIWNSWDFPHNFIAVEEIDSLLFRRYDIRGLQPSFTQYSIAASENPIDGNYPSLSQRYPPNSLNLLTAPNLDYVATWGSVTFGPVRTTNSTRLTSILNPANRGEHFESTVTYSQFGGNPATAFIPRGSTTEYLTVYGLNAKNGSNFLQAIIQKESFPNRVASARDTLVAASGPNVFMRSFQVATDSSGRTLVAWIEGNDIYAQVLDAGLNDLSGSMTVTATGDVEIRNALTELNSPFFGLANLVNGKFIITYGRAGNIYYRYIDAATFSVGAEQILAAGGASHWPSVASAGDKVVFAFFGNLVAGNNRAHLSRFDLDGSNNLSMPSRSDTTLVGFNTTFTHTYGDRAHSWGQIQLAVDAEGNVAAGFNHEVDAYLSMWGNKAYYADTSFYRSSVNEFRVPGVTATWLTGDSIYVHRLDYSSDSLLSLRLNQGSGPTLTSGQNFLASHGQDSVGNVAVDGNYYQYQFAFNAGGNNRYAPVVDSLNIIWNAKPRLPIRVNQQINLGASNVVDSIGLMSKRDSLDLRYRLFDFSAEDSLVLSYQLASEPITQINLGDDSLGFFFHSIRLMPRDSIGWFPFVVWTEDVYGAQSQRDTLWIDFRNDPPIGSLEWSSLNGFGVRDTLAVDGVSTLVFEGGDVANVFGVITDSNVTQLNLRWSTINAGVSGQQSVTAGVGFSFDLVGGSADSLQVRPGLQSWMTGVDTLIVKIDDGEDTLTFRQPYSINHIPWAESVSTVRYGIPWVDSLIRIVEDLPGRAGAFVVPYTPSTLEISADDFDLPKGDSVSTEWYLIDLDSTGICCFNRRGPVANGARINIGDASMANDSLFVGSELWAGASSVKAFYDYPPLLVARSIDRRGASSEDTLLLQYSIADTTKNPYFGSSLDYLKMDLHYAAGSQRLQDTVTAVIHSTGTIPLGIYSLATTVDQGVWLDVESYKPERNVLDTQTDSSRIDPNQPWQIAKGDSIIIRFVIDVEPLRGDYQFVDTLYVETNDFLNSKIPLPFELKVSDMPLADFYYQSLGGISVFDSLVDKAIPLWSELVVVFNEPVLKSSVSSSLQIYSALDSVVRDPNPPTDIAPNYAGQFLMNTAKNANGSSLNNYTDTVRFAPEYFSISDSLKKMPPPQVWIPRDHMRLRVSNAILDTAGNPIDLARNRELLVAGSADTLLNFYIDSTTLQIDTAKSYPKSEGGFDADREIEMFFNAPLSWMNVFDSDTLIAIDTTGMGEGSALGVRLESVKANGEALPLRSIEFRAGDSLLVIRPLRRFFADDTVTLRIESRVSDQWGRTLDGNFDLEGEYLFDRNSSADDYTITFTVADGKFYTFPNPYRAWEPTHQAIGGIRFKNLSKVKGFSEDKKWEIGFYDVTGQNLLRRTLYDPQKDLTPPQEYLWNVRNRAGKKVASGTYLYMFYSDGKVVKKGKVALIR